MAGISLGGLISGASTEDLIAKIMELEKQRLYTQEARQENLEAKQKAWRDVRSSLSTLQSKLNSLRFASLYRSRKVTLTDDSVASMTAASGSALTTYSLDIANLAQAHVITQTDAAARISANEALGASGKFSIGLQSTASEQRKIIEVTATDTLNSLADKINNADVGVMAHVSKVTIDGTEKYRLVLTSSKTGVANAVDLTEVAGEPNPLESLGLEDATGNPAKVLSVAMDAKFTLNGVEYLRSTNVVDDVVPGLTITLKKSTSATVQATVGLDTDKVLESVKAWVEAINSTQDLLKKLASYDAETKTAGVLNGDYLIRNLQTKIRQSISNVVAGLPADLNQMSHVGVTTGAYGTADYGKVIVDETKFREAMEKDADGVAKLFGALQNNVALGSAGSTITLEPGTTTAVGTYSLDDVINGVTDSDRFGTAGGGWMSSDPPSVGPQGFTITFNGTKTISEITLYQPDPADKPASSYGLKDFALEYWDLATGQWVEIEQVEGFAGTIGSYEFDPVTTDRVRLTVTATYNDHNVRISELQVGEYNNGAAIEMYRYIRSTLDIETGGIENRDKTLTKQIQQMRDTIDRLEEQLAAREERLREQFARMEEAMAKMQAQGNAFALQMLGLAGQ